MIRRSRSKTRLAFAAAAARRSMGAMALVALAIGASLAAGPAASQQASPPSVVLTQPATVSVNAMPLGPLDLSQPIALRLMDDSPANRAMADRLATALTAAGRTLVAAESAAALILEVDTAATLAPQRPNPDSGALGISGQAGTGDDEDSVAVRLRVFSTTQVSVLGGDRDAPKPPLGAPDLRLDAGLTDRATGRRLWQGWATITAPDLDQTTRALLLARPLAGALGQTMRGQRATIPAGPLPPASQPVAFDPAPDPAPPADAANPAGR